MPEIVIPISRAGDFVSFESPRFLSGRKIFIWTEEQYVEQARRNSEEMNYFMFQISDALTGISPEDEEPEPPAY